MDPALAGGLAVATALAALAAVVTTRRRRSRRVGPDGRRSGGSAGVREPRRPLVPSGAATAGMPLPDGTA